MYQAYFDGAITINPGGICTYGSLVKKDGQVVWIGKGKVGEGKLMSCNVAEYAGFLSLLEYFKANNLENENISIFGDSKMVIDQMNSSKPKFRGLYAPIARMAQAAIQGFTHLELKWIPRELNIEADELSRFARAA